MSARLSAVALTRTSRSSGPGTGSGISRRVRTSGAPYSAMTMAFMGLLLGESGAWKGRRRRWELSRHGLEEGTGAQWADQVKVHEPFEQGRGESGGRGVGGGRALDVLHERRVDDAPARTEGLVLGIDAEGLGFVAGTDHPGPAAVEDGPRVFGHGFGADPATGEVRRPAAAVGEPEHVVV